jgi:antitoxin (DNA-binding transcriptional repressor) of toxin-antitoxin stability system
MSQVTITEAQKRLPELLTAAEAGETVVIRSDNGRTFTLAIQLSTPIVNRDWPGYPHAGSAKGLIEIHEDFDEPLEELSPRKRRMKKLAESPGHRRADRDRQDPSPDDANGDSPSHG